MEKIKVLYMPSWYPCSKNPKHGIYFKEQATLLSRDADIVVLNIIRIPLKKILFSFFNIGRVKKYTYPDSPDVYTAYYLDWAVGMNAKKGALYQKIVLKAFKKIIRSNWMPELVHAHSTFPAGYGAVAIKDRYGIPFFVTEHASHFENVIMGTFKSFSEKVLASAAFYSGVSNFVKNKIVKYNRKQCEVIPNFIDYKKFDLELSKEGLEYKGKINLINISDIEKLKGIDLLLSALSMLVSNYGKKDVFLHIVGDGVDMQEYKALAKTLGVDKYCKFYGMLVYKDVAKVINYSNMLVVASRVETFGIVAIEAMAAGLPVVSTDCGGPSDYINKDNGILVKPDDAEELAKGINKMIENIVKYDKRKIKDFVKNNYSGEVVTKRVIEGYKKAIS